MEEIRTEVINDKYQDDDNSDTFSDSQGATLWPRRSLLYRVSFAALIPLFAIFLLGFSSPFWMKKHQVDKYRGYYNIKEKVDVSIGLWRVCEGFDYSDITDCTVIPDTTPYMIACQTMLCLSLIFTVFSLIFGLYENCATRYDIEEGNEAKTKRPEMNAVMAGLCGLVGVCMYGTTIIDAARRDEGAVHWAFPVTAATVTGMMVCGILMAIANPIHSTTYSYPGQIMSLSRQNSSRLREANAQDRLVVSNENVVPPSGPHASSTLYGVAGNSYDDKEVPFLQRSESCLSSHMSSPDIYTATLQDQCLPHGHRSTHVVEPHDIHSRAHDHGRKQLTKQQLQDKAAQRRSWHFDDRNGAYIVTDLINNRPGNTLPSQARIERETTDGAKPPVPPRRDKLVLSSNVNRLTENPEMSPTIDQIPDLMVMNDPVVALASKAEQCINTVAMSEDVPVSKRNTNPFIEDAAASENPIDLHSSAASSMSWQNQPWPDPPTDSDMLAQTAPSVPNTSNNNNSTVGDDSTNPVTQLKSVPESLQYQPQNFTTRSVKPGPDQGLKTTCASQKSSDSHPPPTKGINSHSKHQRVRNETSKNTPPPPPPETQVPMKKEYDNPLFKSQPPDGDRPTTLGENFSLQICESTSFVNPSPEEPMPPSYYTAVVTSINDVSNYNRHSGHYKFSPIMEGRNVTGQPATCGVAPPPYTRSNHSAENVPKKHSAAKEKSRTGDKQLQHMNGVVKSRPRQVKREHQQRRSGHPDAGHSQHHPSSPHAGRYGSSPDLVSKSPRQGRRRPDSAGPVAETGYGHEDYNRNFSDRTKTPDRASGMYGYETCRQPQPKYYTTQPGHYRHWVDSDL